MKKLFSLMLLLQISPLTHTMGTVAATTEYAESDLERFDTLEKESAWPQCKKLILHMIKKDPRNVNINGTLLHRCYITPPLYKSVLHQDIDFIIYLLKHNADTNMPKNRSETPLYLNTERLNWALKDDDKDFSANLDHYKLVLKLLIFYGASPDYTHCYWPSPRQLASPETRLLIEQIECEKRIKTEPIYTLITAYTAKDLTPIIADYLNQDVRIIPEEIAPKKTKPGNILVEIAKNIFEWLTNS